MQSNLRYGRWEEGTGNATFSSGMLTVNDGARIIVVGDKNKPDADPFVSSNFSYNTIAVNGNAFITLKDITIISIDSNSPIKLGSGANVTIRPEGSNIAYSQGMGEIIGSPAGIQTTGATLTIDGPGSLTATGSRGFPGGGGAGIGGSGGRRSLSTSDRSGTAGAAGGTVIIKSGTVTAEGGDTASDSFPSGSGAGIGNGSDGAQGDPAVIDDQRNH